MQLRVAQMIAREYASEAPFDASRFKDTDLRPFTSWISRLVFIVAFLSQIIVAWRFWAITWDDSAITLGFSRTFALTGHIEPTPGSGIVEGYSTTLWMLLMALAAKFVGTPAALVAVAKISTLILNLANLLLIRYWFSSWTSETLGNLIAGTVGCGLMFYETINGMETPIIMTLVLVMLILLIFQFLFSLICSNMTDDLFDAGNCEITFYIVSGIFCIYCRYNK